MLRRYWQNQKGAVVALAAFALPALLGFGALAIDVGSLYVTRTQLSNAADAAALGGGARLPADANAAIAAARSVAKKNGVADGEIRVSTRQGAASAKAGADTVIEVNITRTVPLYLAKILGEDTSVINARAVAEVRPSGTVPWIVPFVLPRTTQFNYDQKFRMKVEGRWNDPTVNNPPELDYMNVKITPRQSFDSYLDYLRGGYKEPFSVGNDMQYYAPSSGGKESVDAFAERIAKDSNTDYTQARPGDPRVMLIPLVEQMLPRDTREGKAMKIVGFVAFYLETVHKGSYGRTYHADGRFLKNINVGPGDWSENPNNQFGVWAVKLVR